MIIRKNNDNTVSLVSGKATTTFKGNSVRLNRLMSPKLLIDNCHVVIDLSSVKHIVVQGDAGLEITSLHHRHLPVIETTNLGKKGYVKIDGHFLDLKRRDDRYAVKKIIPTQETDVRETIKVETPDEDELQPIAF